MEFPVWERPPNTGLPPPLTEPLRGSTRLRKSSDTAAELRRRLQMNLSRRAAAGWQKRNPRRIFWTFIWEKKGYATAPKRFHIHPDVPPSGRPSGRSLKTARQTVTNAQMMLAGRGALWTEVRKVKYLLKHKKKRHSRNLRTNHW